MRESNPKSLKYDAVEYLMAARRPAWIKHQTLVRVLGRQPDDPEVAEWQEKRNSSHVVKVLRGKQLPDGSFPCMPWRHVHKFFFHQLVAMGYGMEDSSVRRAVDHLLQDQLPDGGFNADLRTAQGREDRRRSEKGHRMPCLTGMVIKTLIDLGLGPDPRVQELVELLKEDRRPSGGWICIRREDPYCILGGTPWSFAALVSAGVYTERSPEVDQTCEILQSHKEKIIRHGYHRDLGYRCDETLLLPALWGAGLRWDSPLFSELFDALVSKQRPDGSWVFHKNPSVWYTLEATAALAAIPA